MPKNPWLDQISRILAQSPCDFTQCASATPEQITAAELMVYLNAGEEPSIDAKTEMGMALVDVLTVEQAPNLFDYTHWSELVINCPPKPTENNLD